MTQFIHPNEDKIIIEIGAGDGAITAYILDKMAVDAKLYVFEINPALCKILTQLKDDRLILINDGAQNMKSILAKYEITKVDTIISAIPFLVLSDDLTKEILNTCKLMLKEGGIFVQMHYSTTIKKLYKNIFGNVHSYFVALNIPPGYVFTCVKNA
jgi:phospholipid N-methyltransferase